MMACKAVATLVWASNPAFALSSFFAYVNPVVGFRSPVPHIASRTGQAKRFGAPQASRSSEVLSWEELAKLLPSSGLPEPRTIDTALTPEKPTLKGLTLFRERHGWCPYSERVWLALEAKGLPYETVLIDNTGPGQKPGWWSGSTPQVRWETGKQQGESLDIIRELDRKYPESPPLWPSGDVTEMVNAFQKTFPWGTRPSSRAAFLFKGSGAVARSEFEATLDETDELLGRHDDGPFFNGAKISAADIAWAPFLERYAEQLPCLHAGLDPRDVKRWPRLAAWYDGMMQKVPAYAARVRGDNVSWRRVLSMAGYGNAGVRPVLQPKDTSKKILDDTNDGDWSSYTAHRPYIADSPTKEAAARVVRNRVAIAADAVARGALKKSEVDEALRGLAGLLAGIGVEADADSHVVEAAKYLDDRMCVPRDMGVLPSRAVRGLARRLRSNTW